MANEGATLSFSADTTNLTELSLSFAINNQGNGYTTVQLSYIIGGQLPPIAVQLALSIGYGANDNNFQPFRTGDAENQPAVTFVLTFTNGQSNGNNMQTVIDNIQLDATIVPEPATVAGGLLGVLGLCWFQRRRLIGSVRFRRT